MNDDNMKYVLETVENEGLCYAMVNYSDFPNVDSETFHAKRKALVDAYEDLAGWLGVE